MNLKSLLPLACAALAAPAFAQAPAAYESGVLLNAADVLPADLLRGPSYRVREQVATDGFMAHFEIDTDFGTFTAIGVPQAKRRIAECEAIRKLVETSKGDLPLARGLGIVLMSLVLLLNALAQSVKTLAERRYG